MNEQAINPVHRVRPPIQQSLLPWVCANCAHCALSQQPTKSRYALAPCHLLAPLAYAIFAQKPLAFHVAAAIDPRFYTLTEEVRFQLPTGCATFTPRKG